MSQGAYVTLVGYVAQEPNIRTTTTGKAVTELRVGITPRIRDKDSGEWRDGQASYFSVSCWERLAHHVRASMHKGDPVLVKGKFQTRTYEDKDGNPKVETRITADTVGHDLSRGIANYMRNRSKPPAQDGGPADGQAPGNQDAEQRRDPDEMLDEEAIERFGRDLDDADVAARAVAEEPEDEDDDTADAAASPLATPF
jgi:single-strand DNA-binding protein